MNTNHRKEHSAGSFRQAESGRRAFGGHLRTVGNPSPGTRRILSDTRKVVAEPSPDTFGQSEGPRRALAGHFRTVGRRLPSPRRALLGTRKPLAEAALSKLSRLKGGVPRRGEGVSHITCVSLPCERPLRRFAPPPLSGGGA